MTTRRSLLGIALTAPIAAAVKSVDKQERVEVAAAVLAEAMKAIHGGNWSVQISHGSGFVAVSKDFA